MAAVKNLRITVLVENTARGVDVLAEHGLSLLIEADGKHVLFDTGQGKVLRHNMRQLGVTLPQSTKLVLSHGHYDHTGGLSVVFEQMPDIKVYLHPAAIRPKFLRNAKPPHKNVGIPAIGEELLRSSGRDIVWTEGPVEIVDGVCATGEVPRTNDFEDTGGPFCLDTDCTEPDPLLDDQSLFIEMADGVVVVTGCAHSGVINTLDYVQSLMPKKKIIAVLGGTHLIHADNNRLEATAEALKRHDIQTIAPCHCTGTPATAFLWNQFPNHCKPCHVGAVFTF